MCLLGDNVQYRLLGEKGCNFIMNLSSGDPQPIISNVALGPSALGQHWKLLASAHHLIKPHYKLATFSQRQKPMCLLGDIVQYRLLGDKGCNFIMNLSSGDPQPIISNVALEIVGFGSPLDKASI